MEPIHIVTGEPGETWHNNTDKILFQYICEFRNSCGRCIQFAGQIGPWWPLPIHRSCFCSNIAVLPGTRSGPFIDFRKEVEKLDKAQQARVMGASNYRLMEAGVVDWADVVHPQRILSFREVVATKDLTVRQLTNAGVSKYQAQKAYDVTHSEAITLAERTRIALADILESRGLTHEEIRQHVGHALTKRVGAAGAPPTPPPLRPAIRPRAPLLPGLLVAGYVSKRRAEQLRAEQEDDDRRDDHDED